MTAPCPIRTRGDGTSVTFPGALSRRRLPGGRPPGEATEHLSGFGHRFPERTTAQSGTNALAPAVSPGRAPCVHPHIRAVSVKFLRRLAASPYAPCHAASRRRYGLLPLRVTSWRRHALQAGRPGGPTDPPALFRGWRMPGVRAVRKVARSASRAAADRPRPTLPSHRPDPSPPPRPTVHPEPRGCPWSLPAR